MSAEPSATGRTRPSSSVQKVYGTRRKTGKLPFSPSAKYKEALRTDSPSEDEESPTITLRKTKFYSKPPSLPTTAMNPQNALNKTKVPATARKRAIDDDDDDWPPKKKSRCGRPSKSQKNAPRRASMNERVQPDQAKEHQKRRASDPGKPSQYGLPVNMSCLEIDEDDETEIVNAKGEAKSSDGMDSGSCLIWEELSAEIGKQSGVTAQYIQLAAGTPLDDGSLEEGAPRTQSQNVDAGQTNQEIVLDKGQPTRGRGHEESEDGLNPPPTRQRVHSCMELTSQSRVIVASPAEPHGIKDSENTRVIKFKKFLAESDVELSDSAASADYDSESDSDEEDEEMEEERIDPEEPQYSPHQQKIRDYLYEISEVPSPFNIKS